MGRCFMTQDNICVDRIQRQASLAAWRKEITPNTHASEGIPRFPLRFDVLFLVVQIRVIDTAGSGDEQINIARNLHESTICGGSVVVAELSDVPEEDGW